MLYSQYLGRNCQSKNSVFWHKLFFTREKKRPVQFFAFCPQSTLYIIRFHTLNAGSLNIKNGIVTAPTLQVLMQFSSDTKLLPFPSQLVKTNSKHLWSFGSNYHRLIRSSQEPQFGCSRQVSVVESGMTTTSLSLICMIARSDAGFNDDEVFDEGPQESWH